LMGKFHEPKTNLTITPLIAKLKTEEDVNW
jgi:hypothetical protein